jgi:hypothetical protein
MLGEQFRRIESSAAQIASEQVSAVILLLAIGTGAKVDMDIAFFVRPVVDPGEQIKHAAGEGYVRPIDF